MTLHQKIKRILKRHNRFMTPNEIAEIISDEKIKAFEIDSRVRLFPEIFIVDEYLIGLKGWDIKKNISNSELIEKLYNIIIKISEGEEVTEVTLDEIDNSDISKREIEEIIYNNPNIFLFKNGKVSINPLFEGFESYKLNETFRRIHFSRIENENKLKTYRNFKINSFGISNFKGYKDFQKLLIKPITLLFGPNSSGKSSLIHSFLYLNNAFTTNELSPNYMKISGDSVDLGGFNQIIHNGETEKKLLFSIELKNDRLKSKADLLSEIKDIRINIEVSRDLIDTEKIVELKFRNRYISMEVPGMKISTGKPIVSKYEIIIDNIPFLNLKPAKEIKHSLFIDYINYNHKVIKKIIRKSFPKKDIGTKQMSEEIFMNFLNLVSFFYSAESFFIPNNLIDKSYLLDQARLNKFFTYYFKITSAETKANFMNSMFSKNLKIKFSEYFNNILSPIFDILNSNFTQLKYLGPVRKIPTRHLLSDNIHSVDNPNFFPSGEFAWYDLLKDENLLNKINSWLSSLNKIKTKYAFEKRSYLDIQDKKVIELLRQGVHSGLYAGDLLGESYTMLEEIIRNESVKNIIKDLVIIDKESGAVVSHRDVGYGIGQIIPVLVSAYGNKDKMVIIEQPEIHVHPALQAELAEVFVETSVGENNNTFIIETHSEHLLRKLQVLVAKGKLNKEDIAIYYIDKVDGMSKIKEMALEENGFFKEPWPDGFFDESLKLTEELLFADKKN